MMFENGMTKNKSNVHLNVDPEKNAQNIGQMLRFFIFFWKVLIK